MAHAEGDGCSVHPWRGGHLPTGAAAGQALGLGGIHEYIIFLVPITYTRYHF